MVRFVGMRLLRGMSGAKKMGRLSRRAVAVFLGSHIVLLALSCSGGTTDVERAQEGARAAAEAYYNLLLNGDYRQFLNGRAGADSIPESYSEQLMAGYRQFMAEQQQEHLGISSLQATRAEMDTTLQVMQVFLQLCYGDSTQEEIVVPMVSYKGVWMMK